MLEPDGYNDARTAIREIYDRHRGRYGYRRITAQLRNDGMLLNHKTVQKLMVEMNLYGKRKTAKYKSYKGASHIKVRSERLRPMSLTETSRQLHLTRNGQLT